MSDLASPELLEVAGQPAPAEPASATAGSLLRAARERAGLHIAALAVSLKVPVRKLEALEADRFDELPDAVFVRALAGSVCRTLKLDPAPILAKLPGTATPRLSPEQGKVNAPFRLPNENSATWVWPARLSRPLAFAVAALLVGAAVIAFVPELPSFNRSETALRSELPTPSAATDPPAAVQPTIPALTKPVLAADIQSPAGAVPSRVTAAVTPVANPAAAAAPLPAGLVAFNARAETWVEVVDGKGNVTLRKMLIAGETAGASGSLPLSVVVGRAATTDVTVRGAAFDLTQVSRDNVARFQVK